MNGSWGGTVVHGCVRIVYQLNEPVGVVCSVDYRKDRRYKDVTFNNNINFPNCTILSSSYAAGRCTLVMFGTN